MMLTIFRVLKNKVLLFAAIAATIVGGATAAFAATTSNQSAAQTLAHGHPTVTATPKHQSDQEKEGDNDSDGQGKSCPSQDGIQELLRRFHLSVEKNSAAINAVCAMHAGTFTGTTATGTPVSSKHVYGYGEIKQLLILAQFLATKSGVKLSDANVSSYLASAVNTCASSSSITNCLKNTIPNFKPGNDHGDDKGGK